MKTKKVMVEIEIPIDMEVGKTWSIIPENVNIPLHKRKPLELKLRECIGRDYITKGEYFTDVNNTFPRPWNQGYTKYNQFWVENNTIVWELVDEC